MTYTAEIFDAHAGDYDAARRRLIPPFDAFYGTAVEAVGLGAAPPLQSGLGAARPRRILDLGAGTGLLSRFVRQAFPAAHLTLLDGASQMLERARDALGETNTRYVVADLRDPLPAGPWDAVISALAIHHLADDEKRDLFQRVHAALPPGGVFVNAEQVTGPSPRFSDLYARWHEAGARAAGSDDAEWSAALARMAHDRSASVTDQLSWLRAAGFSDADCLFKQYHFAVLVALR